MPEHTPSIDTPSIEKRPPGRPAGSGTKSNLTISFRPDASQQAWLAERAGEGYEAQRHELVRESFDRYRALLDRGRRELAGLFTPEEFMALCDACNGTLFTTDTMHFLHAQIEDADAFMGLSAKWSVDVGSVAERIESLPASATWALVDAIERFWSAASRGEEMSHNAGTMDLLGLVPVHASSQGE